ncbi:hypothetical protein AF335_18720 [Streptomyces eurocidicus]|uniref:Uncharacterized protein n=1 Tax=Streptomyces eurocidicus TaxID=66423 RepID=A0A2N8NUX1_STREU|nr:hypothetical protein AF335_18720 [Streptomyces eurocidicus]
MAVVACVCAVWLLQGGDGRAGGGSVAYASPRTARAPVPSCELGAYLSDLYDLDPSNHVFSARMFLWSVCPDRKLDPLPAVSFSNANDPEKGDPILSAEGGGFRDLMRIQGTFRQGWDVRAFPFDRQRIAVLVTAAPESKRFLLVPDNANSAYNKEIHPPGWRITGFRLTPARRIYPTNFGDPTLPRGTATTYSRIRVEVDLARDDPTIFWKLTGPLYLMVLMATATFLLPSHAEELGMGERLDSLQSRLGLLGGGLFVVMLNMQQVAAVVNSTVGLTLIDWLHLLTLGFVLLAVMVTVVSWRWTVHGGCPARAERWHHVGAVVLLVGYTAIAVLLVGYFAAGER